MAVVDHLCLQPLQSGPGGQDGLAIDRPLPDLDRGLGDRDGIVRFIDQHDPGDPRAGGDVDGQLVVGRIGRAPALMALEDQQVGIGPGGDTHGGRMARLDRIRNEAQPQGLLAPADIGIGPDGAAVGKHHPVPAQGEEGTAPVNQTRRRRRRRVAEPTLQVGVFPRLDPLRREGGGVIQIDADRGVHAAAGRYWSYPSASSLCASSGPPEATIRPATSTCTRSGLM